jgi:hypothetical protein
MPLSESSQVPVSQEFSNFRRDCFNRGLGRCWQWCSSTLGFGQETHLLTVTADDNPLDRATETIYSRTPTIVAARSGRRPRPISPAWRHQPYDFRHGIAIRHYCYLVLFPFLRLNQKKMVACSVDSARCGGGRGLRCFKPRGRQPHQVQPASFFLQGPSRDDPDQWLPHD